MSRNEKNKSAFAEASADKKWFIVMAAVIVSLAFSGLARAGTAWLKRQKLLAADGAAGDVFGWSVSISGDYAIVGAAWDDDNGATSGSAYIFRWDGESWVQQQKLIASDGTAHDRFGDSVYISGDYAIVGACSDWSDNGDTFGSAYIFKRDGTSWVQQQKLLASDGAAHDRFGCSVSISADFAIVGAYLDDDSGDWSGSAYIFKRDGMSWVEQQKLTASDGAADDYFGSSVSICGDLAIVGAYLDDDNGSESGSAYIFRWDGTSWGEQQKLLASDGAAVDDFGYSVSISGDYAIVGAVGDDDNGFNSGSAYIFNWDGIGWSQQAKLVTADGAAEDCFGRSVSISGDYAIVGAIADDDNGDSSGSAYIFKRDGESWSQQQKLLAADGAADDHFGYSVSISADFAIVGADGDDDNGSFSGSAYIFEKCPIADLSGDCCVDFVDFAVIGNQWLQAPGEPSADLAPEGGDGVVNFLDLDILVNQWLFEKCPIADLSGDCCVDFVDFAVIGNQWLQAPGEPSADLAPEGGDGVVNFLDLDILVNQWLKCGDPL